MDKTIIIAIYRHNKNHRTTTLEFRTSFFLHINRTFIETCQRPSMRPKQIVIWRKRGPRDVLMSNGRAL